MIKSDLTLITHNIRTDERDLSHINVYGIGDWHIGSAQADINKFKRCLEIIQEDPEGYICICGDMLNVATKSSVSDIYEDIYNVAKQREILINLLEPVKDRILAVVGGNHEYRLSKETGTTDPLYDVCLLLGIEDLYRADMALVKVGFGNTEKSRFRPNIYGIMVTHGSSIHKHRKFIMQVEGIDAAISGHTHNPHEVPHGKIRVNLQAGTAKQVAFEELVVCAGMDQVGGYGTKKEYPVPAPYRLQYLTLKKISGDRVKQIDYHSEALR